MKDDECLTLKSDGTVELSENASEQMKALAEMYSGEPEALNPELQPYLIEVSGMQMLKHPLVFAVPYMGKMENKRLNKMLEWKEKAIGEAALKDEWFQYISLHEKPYRFDAFVHAADYIDDAMYWELARDTWVIVENVWQHQDGWFDMLSTDERGDPKQFMTEDDLKVWDSLPDQFEIYRGHQGHNKNGLSWTVDREKAEWFAKRLEPKIQRVETRTVLKSDCFAYTDDRDEKEIIYFGAYNEVGARHP